MWNVWNAGSRETDCGEAAALTSHSGGCGVFLHELFRIIFLTKIDFFNKCSFMPLHTPYCVELA